MKFAILFALVAMAFADSRQYAIPAFYNAASSPGFISGGGFYSGSNFVYPGSGFVPTTYSAVAPTNFAFRSAAFPSAVSYQSAPAAAITYSAPVATYSAPVATYSAPVATYSAPITTYSAPITTYKAPAVTYSEIVPKTIAQTKGSSHITY